MAQEKKLHPQLKTSELLNEIVKKDLVAKMASNEIHKVAKKISAAKATLARYKKKILRPYPFLEGDRFYNHRHEHRSKTLLSVLEMFVEGLYNRYYFKSISQEDWFIKPILVPRSQEPRITWVGHSTFLIQTNNVNILTDPIFDKPSWLYPRITKPGLELHELPPIDVVVISHNHWDHLEINSLAHIAARYPQAQFLVPEGDKALLKKAGIPLVYEKMWWDEQIVKAPITLEAEYPLNSNKVTCTFLPADHYSLRGLFDRNKSLWGSWMIEADGVNIYFAGDTAYSKHFKDIGAQYDTIDFALMPIGPCEPERMRHSHVNAQEAGQGFLDLGARHFIPMHWAAFFFGVDKFFTPIEYLQKWWKEHEALLTQCHLHIAKCGEHIQFSLADTVSHVTDRVFKRVQV